MKIKPYKIESGIKIPEMGKSGGGTEVSMAALAMGKLEKGDSFLIKDELTSLRASKAMRDFNRRESTRGSKRAFLSRKSGKGVRIWRVK